MFPEGRGPGLVCVGTSIITTAKRSLSNRHSASASKAEARTNPRLTHDLLVLAGADPAHHPPQRRPRHGLGGLELRVSLQWHLAAAATRRTRGRPIGSFCPASVTVPSVPCARAVGPAPVAGAAQPGQLVLQDGGGDQQAQFDGQAFQGVLYQQEPPLTFQLCQGHPRCYSPCRCLG
jgi:hypothetical protein